MLAVLRVTVRRKYSGANPASRSGSAPVPRSIDFNCDMGESFGPWRMGDDAAVMPWITSANIACGFHAGDSETMRATVALACEHGVAIGAHVGLPDLAGFGRRALAVTPEQVYAYTLHQLGALDAFARAAGTRIAHVKAHGALYHMVASETPLAVAMVRAVRRFDSALLLFGPAPSALAAASAQARIRFIAEGFADRRYASDGRLLGREISGSVIDRVDDAVSQALTLLAPAWRHRSADGSAVRIETLCLHGDRADAGEFARSLREAISSSGVQVQAPALPDASA